MQCRVDGVHSEWAAPRGGDEQYITLNARVNSRNAHVRGRHRALAAARRDERSTDMATPLNWRKLWNEQPTMSQITDWHAHVYFDAPSRDAAWALRHVIETQIGDAVTLGRFHEKPVGPHPQWSYQLAFDGANFQRVFEWLVLNRQGLDVFVHPNTGNALVDHRDRAIWIGRSYPLNLAVLGS